MLVDFRLLRAFRVYGSSVRELRGECEKYSCQGRWDGPHKLSLARSSFSARWSFWARRSSCRPSTSCWWCLHSVP